MDQVITIASRDISVVIPVKDNQKGIDQFLSTFFSTHTSTDYPAEVIIVDNNSKQPINISDKWLNQGLNIRVVPCSKPGPAAARNQGAKEAKGKWLLFVDSDCIPTATMINGYLNVKEGVVGYQGFVGAFGKDAVSRYYESQQIHQPPYKTGNDGKKTPKYLVTANILVNKEVFESIGGFDEFYVFSGEDIDFGSRLAMVGQLAYARDAVILHDYDDGFWGLVRRFIAYGKGNRLVQQKLKIPLYPFPFTPKNKRLWINYILAMVQWLCLLLGYILKSIELTIKRGT